MSKLKMGHTITRQVTRQEHILLEMGVVLWKYRNSPAMSQPIVSEVIDIDVIQLFDNQQCCKAYVLLEHNDIQQHEALWQRIVHAMSCEYKICPKKPLWLLEHAATVIIIMGHERLAGVLHLQEVFQNNSISSKYKQSDIIISHSLSDIAQDGALKRVVWQSLQQAMALMKA